MQRKFTILLSASVPSAERSAEFRKIPNAQIQIEQAVVGLARNVFEKEGRLVFGGHPSISPLVALIAGEYEIDREAESLNKKERPDKPIHIYQSRAYEKVMPDETSALFNLGYAQIIWTPAIDNERCDPEIKNAPQCEKSLEAMRKQMIDENIDAMVCMGGMEGVIKEFALFREKHPDKPVYLFESTGGATQNLAQAHRNSDIVKVIDAKSNDLRDIEKDKNDDREKIELVPYTFFTAVIVDKVLNEARGQ